MSRFTVAIQCSSMGQRCGIYTYSQRLEEFLNKEDIDTFIFDSKIKKDKKPDIVSIQYEPGIVPQGKLTELLQKYTLPTIITVHHTGQLPRFYDKADGFIFHDETQIKADPKLGEPWDSRIIPHPALVFPEKGKKEMREKYGIPQDKKVIGTAGFIAGTGKNLPEMVEELFKDLKDDEFIYMITAFWKGGDFGYKQRIIDYVESLGKSGQFKIDTDFVPADILNEKMQCCDLLFSWNSSKTPGSNSGIAMDMIGAHRKVIVKDAPHYHTPAGIPNVLVGRQEQPDFARDILNALRNEDLTKLADPDPYDWNVLIKDMVDYYEEFL